MKTYLDKSSIWKYYVARVLPHLGILLAIFLSARAFWSPISNIETTIPGFSILLFSVYAVSLSAFYIAFSKFPIRVLSWSAVVIALAFLAFAVFTSIPDYDSEFAFFFSRYVWIFSIFMFIAGLIFGLGFARWKRFVFVEVLSILFFGGYVFTLLDRFSGSVILIMALVLIWYIAHSLAFERFFRIKSENPETKTMFARDFLKKYIIYFAVFLMLFLLFNAFPAIFKDSFVRKPNTPYSDKGRPAENLPSPSHYIHELDPYISLEDEMDASDRILLFNVFVRDYARLSSRYPALYLQQYAMGKFDPQLLRFEMETEDTFLNSVFPGIIPTQGLYLPKGATFPLFMGELSWFDRRTRRWSPINPVERESMDVIVRLTPFVSDNSLIYPNFPTFVSVIDKTPVSEIVETLREKHGEGDAFAEALERSYKLIYHIEALTYPMQLQEITEQRLYDSTIARPNVALSSFESNYFTYTGEGYGKVSSNFIEFTKRLTENDHTPLEKIRRIGDFFMRTENRPPLYGKPFTYNIEPGPPRGEYADNYLDYFMFENREGYCQYYALASAVMLRILGIPSRAAGGYLAIDRSVKNPGHFYIYANQAHAWTEVFFEGTGWVGLDFQPFSESDYRPPSADPTPENPPTLPEYTDITVLGVISALYPEEGEIFIIPSAYQLGGEDGIIFRMPDNHDKVSSYGLKMEFELKTIITNATNVYTNLPRTDLYKIHYPEFYLDLAIAKGRFHNDQIRKLRRSPDKIVFDIISLTIDKDRLSLSNLLERDKDDKSAISLALPLRIFIILLILCALFYSIAPLTVLFFRLNLYTARDSKTRLALIFNYFLLRLFLLKEETFGFTRMEWTEHIAKKYGINFTALTRKYLRTIYDPSYDSDYSRKNLQRDLNKFINDLKSSFNTGERIAGFLSPFRLRLFLKTRIYPEWKEEQK
jgi:hypothetical protein